MYAWIRGVSIPTPDTRMYPSIDELTSKRRKSIRVVVPSIVDSLPVYPIFLPRLKTHLDWISILSTPPTNSIKLLPSKFNETVNTIPHSPPDWKISSYRQNSTSNRIIVAKSKAKKSKQTSIELQLYHCYRFTENGARSRIIGGFENRSQSGTLGDRHPAKWSQFAYLSVRMLLARRQTVSTIDRIYEGRGARERGSRNRLSHVPPRMCRGTREPASNTAPIDFRRASMSGVARPRASKQGYNTVEPPPPPRARPSPCRRHNRRPHRALSLINSQMQY